MNINEVSAAVRAACDTLKEKKDAVYTALEGVSKKLHDDKINKMDSPFSDPFDVDDLECAVVETGAPVDGKRIVAYCKALCMSAKKWLPTQTIAPPLQKQPFPRRALYRVGPGHSNYFAVFMQE